MRQSGPFQALPYLFIHFPNGVRHLFLNSLEMRIGGSEFLLQFQHPVRYSLVQGYSFKMDETRKGKIYNRISNEFNVNTFHKYYYCSGQTLESLTNKLRKKYGQNIEIFVRVDHVVVRQEKTIYLFLLTNHSRGKCADFLHEGWCCFFKSFLN